MNTKAQPTLRQKIEANLQRTGDWQGRTPEEVAAHHEETDRYNADSPAYSRDSDCIHNWVIPKPKPYCSRCGVPDFLPAAPPEAKPTAFEEYFAAKYPETNKAAWREKNDPSYANVSHSNYATKQRHRETWNAASAAAPPEAKPTLQRRFSPTAYEWAEGASIEDIAELYEAKFPPDLGYELADEDDDLRAIAANQRDAVWAMVHEHLPHGVGETTVRQLWPLLVELVEARKTNQTLHYLITRMSANTSS